MAKRGYASKSNLLKAFQCTLYRLKTSFQWHIMREKSRLLLCVSYVLMSEWVYLYQNTIRRTSNPSTCQPVNFCKPFSKKFNTKSGLFIDQLLTLPQKNDSREGLVWCKKGLVCECGKMNFYLIKPSFAPVRGPFPAKCSAFWCKTRCILVLNAVRFGAKCKVKWCKMRGKMVQNAVLNAAKCKTKSIYIHRNGTNKTF